MIPLQQGDIFTTRNPMWLGRSIVAAETFWSEDNKAEYSHAGIVISEEGDTLESLWTIRCNHIDKYIGQKVLVGRVKVMGDDLYWRGWKQVKHLKGRIYPFWRLPLFLFPPLAKYLPTGNTPVCSELAAKFLWGCGVFDYWRGLNPDHIADRLNRWHQFDVVYEGVWE